MRILIIENEKELLRSLKMGFEAECFAVDAIEDGEKALYMAKTTDYDVILSDYMLPGKTGKEICTELRSEGRLTPIVMLTGKSEVADRVDLLDIGADDYICKPFSYEELFARVRSVLRRPKKMDGEIITIGDLTVDTRRHEIAYAGEEIYLTRKEFMLLEYLARNCGTVVSRASLMEHVWDMNADPFSNTIESHVLNLRSKLQKFYKQKVIHTIPGRGYKILL